MKTILGKMALFSALLNQSLIFEEEYNTPKPIYYESEIEKLREYKNRYILRAKTEPFDFIREIKYKNKKSFLYHTIKISESTLFTKTQAKELIKKNPHLKMVKFKHLPLRTLLKREKELFANE